ncbi:MAG: hypothetical protein O7B23_08910 [Deltaproteobacteria bacterium]|nr:hypothetical protein [Deltaproteobacteria bacterium]
MSGSVDLSRQLPLRARIEYHRSRYTFFRKHRGPVSYWALMAVAWIKAALGSLLGGRRAAEYRKILAWHGRRGCPASAGLPPLAESAESLRERSHWMGVWRRAR